MKKYWILIVIVLFIIGGFIPFMKGRTICPFIPPCFEYKISLFDWIRYRDNLKSIKNIENYNYVNSEYNFQLTLTNAWKNYKVFISQGSQGVGAPTYLEFSLITSDKSRNVMNVTDEIFGYAAPLAITIISKDRNYQGIGVKITEDNENTYYYTINKDLPTDLRGINFEIPKVISTFKFTN